MATMYDGANAATVPAGADVYAGYVDGNYQTYQPLVEKYPDAQHVSICVASNSNAQVLDIENGDAHATEAPAWLARQRQLGQVRPTIYCSRVGDATHGWPAVKAAIAAAHMDPPDYWIADQTGTSHGLEGAVAVQFRDVNELYDESLITDSSWPGTATSPSPAAPSPPAAAPSTPADEISYVVREGDTLSEIAVKVGSTVDALAKRNGITNVDAIHTGQVLIVPR